MARIRTIKPEFWAHQQLGRMSFGARLTVVGLISLADDEGRGRADPEWLWGQLHSQGGGSAKARWKGILKEVEAAKDDNGPIVVFYEVAGARYYWLTGFYRQQRIDKPHYSKLPMPPDSEMLLRYLKERPTLYQVSGRGSGKGEEGEGKDPAPPPGDLFETGGSAPPAPQEDPGLQDLVSLYDFCKTPGRKAKADAFSDLMRQGVTSEQISNLPKRIVVTDRDFWEIVDLLRPKKKPDKSPPTGKKKNQCQHEHAVQIEIRNGEALFECRSKDCDHYNLPWREWRPVKADPI